MKKFSSLLVVLTFLGCESHMNIKMDESKLIRDVKGYKDAKYKSIFKVYEDSRKDFFIVKDKKIIYKNLKFVSFLYDKFSARNEYSLQILDKDNNRKIIKIHSDVLQAPKYGCGTAAVMANTSYHFLSLKELNGFSIFIDYVTGFGVMSEKTTISLKDVSHIDTVLFPNLKSSYIVNSDSDMNSLSWLLFFKKGEKTGILGVINVHEKKFKFEKLSKLITYDKISITNGILLEKGSLMGYFNITEVKYSSLEPFIYNLAHFTLPNGKVGYIDRKGNEYYD
jgi:hypothetical protein